MENICAIFLDMKGGVKKMPWRQMPVPLELNDEQNNSPTGSKICRSLIPDRIYRGAGLSMLQTMGTKGTEWKFSSRFGFELDKFHQHGERFHFPSYHMQNHILYTPCKLALANHNILSSSCPNCVSNPMAKRRTHFMN